MRLGLTLCKEKIIVFSQEIHHYFFMATVCFNWTFIGTIKRITRWGHDKNSNTSSKCRREPFFGDFVWLHSSEFPPPPLPITFQTGGSAASLSHSLSAAHGISQRESQGQPWLRLPLPWKPNRHPGDKHWATELPQWVPSLPRCPVSPWEK